ncbi:MAG: GNAT family N-acetyltransferase [Lachnospiraceae bacterium]|nr:GNAT family N-acetyltransferase [Lachnospiraceae bacterium]
MNIRRANKQDSSAICRISSNDLGYECDEELVSRRLHNIDDNREAVFVAEVDYEVVGYIHVEKYELLYYESMVNILGIAVSSGYRKRGIGKALLNHAENWAKESSINIIRLNSGITRKEAHEFYRAMGFDSEKGQICFNKKL